MNKIILLVFLTVVFGFQNSNAQAFEAKNFNVDIGYVIGSHSGAFYSPGVMLSLEKGIHKWIGAGAYVGVQYNIAAYSLWWGQTYGYNRVSMPVGGFGTFHFYQMISDLVDKDIKADKLDLSLKTAFGARFDFESPVDVHFDWGVSLNARYFVSKNVGLYLELGHPAMGSAIIGAAFKF